MYAHRKKCLSKPKTDTPNSDRPESRPHRTQSGEGIAYLVTSSVLCGVKVGFWRTDILTLYKRYKTVYGDDATFEIYKSCNCVLVEEIFKILFVESNIYKSAREIFESEGLEAYKKVLAHLSSLSELDLVHTRISCDTVGRERVLDDMLTKNAGDEE